MFSRDEFEDGNETASNYSGCSDYGGESKSITVNIQPRSAYTAAAIRSSIMNGINLGIAPSASLLRVAIPELFGETTGDPGELLRERQWWLGQIELMVRLGITPSETSIRLAYDESYFLRR